MLSAFLAVIAEGGPLGLLPWLTLATMALMVMAACVVLWVGIGVFVYGALFG